MRIDYHCKLCAAAGAVEIPDDEVYPFAIELWKPILTCDRCSDFLESKRRIEDGIKSLVEIINQLRITKPRGMEQHLEDIRGVLTEKTRAFSKVVCNHTRKPFMWEPDFPQMIMDQPTKWKVILDQFVRGLGGRLLAPRRE